MLSITLNITSALVFLESSIKRNFHYKITPDTPMLPLKLLRENGIWVHHLHIRKPKKLLQENL